MCPSEAKQSNSCYLHRVARVVRVARVARVGRATVNSREFLAMATATPRATSAL